MVDVNTDSEASEVLRGHVDGGDHSSAGKANGTPEHLKCGICKGAFSDPRLLRCLHAFCTDCLQRLVSQQKDNDVVCHLCGDTTSVPRGRVSALPVDRLSVNCLALHRLRHGAETIPCDVCGGDDDLATNRCQECHLFMCDLHTRAHGKAGKTLGHALQSVDALRREDGEPTSSTDFAGVRPVFTCSKHDRKKVKVFCDNCQTMSCRNCAIFDHRNHAFRPIPDAAERQRDSVKPHIVAAQETAAFVERVNSSVQSTQEELSSCAERVCADIRRTAEKHRELISRRENTLLTHAQHLYQKKTELLTAQSAKLTKLGNRVEQSIAYASRVLEQGSNEEVIDVWSSLVDRLSGLALTKQDLPDVPLDDGALCFQFSDECEKSIEAFGQVSTRPFAQTSRVDFDETMHAEDEISGQILLCDSLGQPCSESNLDDVAITAKVVDSRHNGEDQTDGVHTTPEFSDFCSRKGTWNVSFPELQGISSPNELLISAAIRPTSEFSLQQGPVSIKNSRPPSPWFEHRGSLRTHAVCCAISAACRMLTWQSMSAKLLNSELIKRGKR